MQDPDTEEGRIDSLLREMNIHLPDIHQDEDDPADTPVIKAWEFRDVINSLEGIDALGGQLPRE